ncbi:carboxymuconolactone decarboxylase family protein [Ktedonobacter sp. SOSP1-85]|uniref:carboxymuconolactone decarboxylase family protein n=1 Tax=Ktedonobacter sp. SOSP1-85 TaxID=2778367 RepID=UPI0035B1E12C
MSLPIQQSPEFFKQLKAFSSAVKESTIEETIRDRAVIRALHINGCIVCKDMHIELASL